MHDLLVIGGGFWGSAVAAHAEHLGMDVLVLDDDSPTGASRAAAGLLHTEWFTGQLATVLPRWWNAKQLAYALDWLTEHWKLAQTTFEFTNKDKRRERPIYALPAGFALSTAELAGVRCLSHVDGAWAAHCSDGSEYQAERVVVAAGVGTDALLKASDLDPPGVKPLRGAALIAHISNGLSDVPAICGYMARPYTTYMVRRLSDGVIRCGDTVERKPQPEDKTEALLLGVAQKYFPEARPITLVSGERPVCKEGVFVERMAKDLVVATGGHRIGLGIAPAAARRALQLLKLL